VLLHGAWTDSATAPVDPMLTARPDFPALSQGSRAALVRLLVHGAASRSDLARHLLLSATSLTRIVRSLEEGDLVFESEVAVPQRTGRPSQAMDVNVDRAHLVGVKLLGGEMDVVRTDMRAQLLSQRVIPFGGSGFDDVLRLIVEAVAREKELDPLVASLGISLAGPVAPTGEIVRQSPFLGWENVPLASIVREKVGLPTAVENDVRALTAAEHWFGAAAGSTDFALVTIGQGVGCGLVVDDKLVDGTGGAAGQVGHLPVTSNGPLCERGHRGCVRSYLSSTMMVSQASMALGNPDLTYAQLVELAGESNRIALRVLSDAAFALGTVIGTMAAMTAPSKVIISGEGVTMLPLVMDTVIERAREVEHWAVPEVPIEVAPFTFIEWARGAAVIGLQHLLNIAVRPS
jgi:predicted NBD/HSP70 family sugar kinase